MLTEKVILASSSPRRAEILRAVGWRFEAVAANIDETRHPSEDAVAYVQRLAQSKANAVSKNVPGGLVLGADTVVVIENEILGQPRDDDDARRMLRLLNGKWHEVVTGVAVQRVGERANSVVDYERTRVRFSVMSEAEIEWYVATGEPRDKAGAYAIQGKGALFVAEVAGDYFNIVGLPIRLVHKLAQQVDR